MSGTLSNLAVSQYNNVSLEFLKIKAMGTCALSSNFTPQHQTEASHTGFDLIEYKTISS